MNSVISKIEHSSSLNDNRWKLNTFDERNALALSQKFGLASIVGKLLSIRNIKENDLEFYFNPNINHYGYNCNENAWFGLTFVGLCID